MEIRLEENGLRVVFRVSDEKTVELAEFVPSGTPRALPETDKAFRPLLGCLVTGGSTTRSGAHKRDTGSENRRFRYVSHETAPTADGKVFRLRAATDNGLSAVYQMRFYNGVRAVRTFVTLTNEGAEPIGLDYITSFFYNGIGASRDYFDAVKIFVPTSAWACECVWTAFPARFRLKTASFP